MTDKKMKVMSPELEKTIQQHSNLMVFNRMNDEQKAAFISAALVNAPEWISIKHDMPSNAQKCWIAHKKWGVIQATFFCKDAFDRLNVFITPDGGHIDMSEVTHYQAVYIPAPPSTM